MTPDQAVEKVARVIWNHFGRRQGGDYDGAAGTMARADVDGLAREIIALLSPSPASPDVEGVVGRLEKSQRLREPWQQGANVQFRAVDEETITEIIALLRSLSGRIVELENQGFSSVASRFPDTPIGDCAPSREES
jgi:hypothetical protein